MTQYNRFFIVSGSRLNEITKDDAEHNQQTAERLQEYGDGRGGVAHFFTDSHGFAGFEFPAGIVPEDWTQVNENPDLFAPPKEELADLGSLTVPHDALRHFGLAGHYVQSTENENAIAVPTIEGDLANGPVIVVVPWDDEAECDWQPPADWQEVDMNEANAVMDQIAPRQEEDQTA